MNAKPRVGVVGAGYWGKNVLRNFAALDALAAFCDRDAAALARYAELYPGVPAYGDARAMLGADGIDAVAIITPPDSHGALVAEALTAGKHVFVEKPMCLDLAEAKELRRRAEAAGLTLMVGHILRYHPAYGKLKKIVRSGRLGVLQYLYSNRLSLGKIRREESALWSFAPHDISMILDLVGEMPDRVDTNGGAYVSHGIADITVSHLTFPSGIQAHILVSWLHPYKDQRLVVVGADGMAVFDDVVEPSQKLLIYPHTVDREGRIPTVQHAAAEPVPIEPVEPLRLECSHFLDSIVNGRRPLTDAEEGIRVLKVLDACQRSLTTLQPVFLR